MVSLLEHSRKGSMDATRPRLNPPHCQSLCVGEGQSRGARDLLKHTPWEGKAVQPAAQPVEEEPPDHQVQHRRRFNSLNIDNL